MAPRVVVYTHKDSEQFARRLAGEKIHRVEALELDAVDRAFVAALAARLDWRMAFALSVVDHDLFLSVGTETLTGVVTQFRV